MTPKEVCDRTGWHQSYVSRLLAGKSPLTRANLVLLANALGCTTETLQEAIGEPIPKQTTEAVSRSDISMSLYGLARRSNAVATLLGIDNGDSLMAYLIYGDESGVPKRTRIRLHVLKDIDAEAHDDVAA
jgi:hypothetical protein